MDFFQCCKRFRSGSLFKKYIKELSIMLGLEVYNCENREEESLFLNMLAISSQDKILRMCPLRAAVKEWRESVVITDEIVRVNEIPEARRGWSSVIELCNFLVGGTNLMWLWVVLRAANNNTSETGFLKDITGLVRAGLGGIYYLGLAKSLFLGTAVWVLRKKE